MIFVRLWYRNDVSQNCAHEHCPTYKLGLFSWDTKFLLIVVDLVGRMLRAVFFQTKCLASDKLPARLIGCILNHGNLPQLTQPISSTSVIECATENGMSLQGDLFLEKSYFKMNIYLRCFIPTSVICFISSFRR